MESDYLILAKHKSKSTPYCLEINDHRRTSEALITRRPWCSLGLTLNCRNTREAIDWCDVSHTLPTHSILTQPIQAKDEAANGKGRHGKHLLKDAEFI